MAPVRGVSGNDGWIEWRFGGKVVYQYGSEYFVVFGLVKDGAFFDAAIVDMIITAGGVLSDSVFVGHVFIYKISQLFPRCQEVGPLCDSMLDEGTGGGGDGFGEGNIMKSAGFVWTYESCIDGYDN